MKDMRVNARVKFTVVVDTNGPWGEDCTLGQARKQAIDQAINTLNRLLGETTEPDNRTRAARCVGRGKLLSLELIPEKQ